MGNYVKYSSFIRTSNTKLTIQPVKDSSRKGFYLLRMTLVARNIIIVMHADMVVDKGGFLRSYQSLLMKKLSLYRKQKALY